MVTYGYKNVVIVSMYLNVQSLCGIHEVNIMYVNFVCVLSHFSCVWLFVILWTVTRQAPLSMVFSRQEFYSGLPCPPPGDLYNPGDWTCVSNISWLADRFFSTRATWEVQVNCTSTKMPSGPVTVVWIYGIFEKKTIWCLCLLKCVCVCGWASVCTRVCFSPGPVPKCIIG